MRDAFGVTIEAGDYVLSAATSTGSLTTGHVYMVGVTPRLLIRWSRFGHRVSRVELGSNVVVLRKADGSEPSHLWPGLEGASCSSES